MFERMMHDLARLRRRAVGRRPQPRLAIIDTQTVKCLPVRGPRGYDAAKRVVGRKRVALVDTEGHWLAVAVVPASVQERDTLTALNDGKAARPSTASRASFRVLTVRQPQRRASLVLHQVSSRKTIWSGFSPLCAARRVRHAAARSGRSCSV